MKKKNMKNIKKNKKRGITASCFDLLHAGHILMLKEAKSVCDHLVVALQVDPTIDRPEKNKPIQSYYERWVQLSAVKYVDEIIPYTTEEELMTILLNYKIDIRILGEEYEGKEFTGKNIPMEYHFNMRTHNYSSTELKNRIKSLA